MGALARKRGWPKAYSGRQRSGDLMVVVVRLQIMRIVGVIVRLESVFRVLMSVPIVAAMLVWVGMLMNMRMGMLMGVLVRVRDIAMAMLMAMSVQMRMVVTVTVFVISVHRSHPS